MASVKFGHVSVSKDGLEFTSGLRVWLEWEEVTQKCFEADDIAGYVNCYVLSDNGTVVLNADKSEVLTEKLYGNVRIAHK